MISVTITTGDFGKLAALLHRMRPAGRAQLNQVGANAAAAKVQRHIHGYARGKHFSAASLGGRPTKHYENGAEAITASSSADSAEVVIPIPGISRAFHDIELTTPTRFGKDYLTIARHRESYGRTVGEMKLRGWTVYRPGRRKDGSYGPDAPKILLGYRRKGDEPVVLYTLTKQVRQKKDPSLLPTRQELANAFAMAQKLEIERVLRNNRMGK